MITPDLIDKAKNEQSSDKQGSGKKRLASDLLNYEPLFK